MERQIQIRLVTRDDEYRVSGDPLFVPVSLKRWGLSSIVNTLLGTEDTEQAVPFEFLIDGEVLRTSLDAYIQRKGVSPETTLVVEYARSILPPSFLASFSDDDWLSSVHINRDGPSIATGSYDGVVKVWDRSGKVTHKLAGHSGAVKAVRWAGAHRMVSGGNDRQVFVWKVGDSDKAGDNDEDLKKSSVAAVLLGHTAAVDDVAVHPATGRIVSASADGTLRVWSVNHKELPDAAYTEATSKSSASEKRRRIAQRSLASARTKGSLLTLDRHTAPVAGVAFHHTDAHVVYSVSQDHTVRTWDISTGTLVDTRTTSFPLLSVASMGPHTGLIACGSSARHITLHDPRAATTTTQSQLVGHTNFVVSLAPAGPNRPYTLASGSHDGTTRIWDVRATKPVYTLPRESGESSSVFGVDWHPSVGIASAGQDKKLQINSAALD